MPVSKANAEWTGPLKGGRGVMRPAHGSDVPFSLGTRFEGAQGSNPEEMIGAALAGCFSMALSVGLEKANVTPVAIRTTAEVHLDKDGEGFAISRIDLATEIKAHGADEAKIRAIAEETKKGCPVSKALTGTTIALRVNVSGV